MENISSKMIKNTAIAILMLCIASCGNNKADNKVTVTEKKDTVTTTNTTTEVKSAVEDGPAIATIETSDYILKLHQVIEFTPKPKSYQPFKIDPGTKLAVLDISVRNKLSVPLNFSRILGMTNVKGNGPKNLVSPWVVAAYITDFPDANHQKEYDALWNSSFEPNGFHRSILIGINPKQEENDFTLVIPGKADFNNPENKELKFSLK
jgi:hypothetical protein